VGGPTAGVPNSGTVKLNEQTLEVVYPDGFPLVDDFDTDS